MDPDLARLLSEDEAARAGVESARIRARAQLEAARAELAQARDARSRERQRDRDRAVAEVLADGDRESARRRTQREARARDDAARSAPLLTRGAELWVQIVREGVDPGESP